MAYTGANKRRQVSALTGHLLAYLVISVIAVQGSAAASLSAGGESCFMTLIVPKEKIKNSCNVQEQFEKKLGYLEGQVNLQRKLLQDMETLLLKEQRRQHGTNVQVDPGNVGQISASEDEDFIDSRPPLPDLSDDYHDYGDYEPPEVVSRMSRVPYKKGSGRPGPDRPKKPAKQNTQSEKGGGGGVNLMAVDILKPYIDSELKKLRENLTSLIADALKPFSAGFKEVQMFAQHNHSIQTNMVGMEAQTSMNTIALSHIFIQMTNFQNRILHCNTQQLSLQRKVNILENQVSSLSQVAGHKTTDLRSRILELEHENRLLKVNQTSCLQMSQLRQELYDELTKVKDQQRATCKNRRKFKSGAVRRARILPRDYEYEMDESDSDAADNVIDDEAWKPLEETAVFQELAKNVTMLRTMLSMQSQRFDNLHQDMLNKSATHLEQETKERQNVDLQLNRTITQGLGSIRQNFTQLSRQMNLYREMSVKEHGENNQKYEELESQLTESMDTVTALENTIATNLTQHRKQVETVLTSYEKSLNSLGMDNMEFKAKLDTFVVTSERRASNTSQNIEQWKVKLKQTNDSIRILTGKLWAMRTNVIESLSSLNNSVYNLDVELKINNETWFSYKFKFAKGHNKCYGEQYVKKTNYDVGSFVGVILCTPDRYKIFLSDSLTDTFLDIADSSGFGHDHCEFVGGVSERTVQVGATPVFYERQPGYKRHMWGQQPRRAHLSIINPSPEWYKCALYIPA